MTRNKVFKVEFDIEPIDKSDALIKSAGIAWWDVIIHSTAYIVAIDIVSALTKAIINLDEFAKKVKVKEGYRICGVRGVSEYQEEVFM